MSGPKSYKSYSIKAFDGKFNEIFCLQSDIIHTFKELKMLSVKDNERDISYENYYNNSLNSLKNFKTNVIYYIEKNTDDKHKKKFEKTNEKIEIFEPTFKKINFEFGFQDVEKSNKEKVSKYITQSENKLGDLKNKIVKRPYHHIF